MMPKRCEERCQELRRLQKEPDPQGKQPDLLKAEDAGIPKANSHIVTLLLNNFIFGKSVSFFRFPFPPSNVILIIAHVLLPVEQ